MNQLGLFDLQNRLESLEKVGDPLLRLNQVLPWDSFRPLLSRIRDKERKSPAGRKPFDELLLFKMLILQRLYNLSDHGSTGSPTIRWNSKSGIDSHSCVFWVWVSKTRFPMKRRYGPFGKSFPRWDWSGN